MSTAEVSAEEPELPDAAVGAIRAAVHAELDDVLPYVIEALRRNNAFDEISDRLRAAERRIESRQERPVIIGLHGVLDRIRHLDFDHAVKKALEDDLTRVLGEAGYQETGQDGEAFDPARHDAIERPRGGRKGGGHQGAQPRTRLVRRCGHPGQGGDLAGAGPRGRGMTRSYWGKWSGFSGSIWAPRTP